MSSTRVAATSSTGLVRTRNEDSAYVGRWMLAVADGMGGHAAGDVASATVIEAIRRFDVQADEPQGLTALLGDAVREANEKLADKVRADPDLASMGSTLTAMLWSGQHVAIAHIGDSRAYRLRDGAFTTLTEDHVVGKLVADPMPAEISEHLVRFLDARPGWSPDLTLRTTLPGDRYLICSDGLSSFVDAGSIRDVLAHVADLDQAVADLVRLAYDAGAPDNVTVIAAELPDGEWHERAGEPLILGSAADVAALP
jgi:PPM family protein phosphatase